VLDTIDERRSLLHRPTTWLLPTQEVAEMCPNGDASGSHGYGASLLRAGSVEYFFGAWSPELRAKKMNIAVLESWVMIMVAATWGHTFSQKKVVFRTDSAATCFCLNRLWSASPAMDIMCKLWEDVQFAFGFEGMVTHCSHRENRLADVLSRRASITMEAAVLTVLEERGVTATIQRVELVTTAGDVNIWVEDALLEC
jgi:hypothetical protein